MEINPQKRENEYQKFLEDCGISDTPDNYNEYLHQRNLSEEEILKILTDDFDAIKEAIKTADPENMSFLGELINDRDYNHLFEFMEQYKKTK